MNRLLPLVFASSVATLMLTAGCSSSNSPDAPVDSGLGDESDPSISNPLDTTGGGSTSIPAAGDTPINANLMGTLVLQGLSTPDALVHDTINPALREFQFSNSTPVSGLTLQGTEPVADDGSDRIRSTFQCEGGGTFVLEPTGNVYGDGKLVFNDCLLGDSQRNGSVFIATGSGVDAGFTYTNYEQQQPSTSVTIQLNGDAGYSATRSGNYRSYYFSGLDYTISGALGKDPVHITGLDQSATYSEEATPSQSFSTSYTVDAYWTDGRTLQVETTEPFANFVAQNGLYATGRLQILDPASPGNSLELNADSGDVNTFVVTVVDNGVTTSEIRNWSDLPFTLPCLASPGDEPAALSCR